MVQGWRVLAAAVVLGAVGLVLSGCTPRQGYARIDNRSSYDLVASHAGRVTYGSADAGASGSIDVGDPGECIDEIHLATADGSRVAVVDHPVCDNEVLVIRDQHLVPAASITLENTSGVPFDRGHAGATSIGALPPDATLVVPLPIPAGRCADLYVSVWALDDNHQMSAEARLADRVCDQDLLTVCPEIVEVKTTGGWQWLAQGSQPPGEQPSCLSSRGGPAATVTMANGTDIEIVANLGLLEHVALAPGQSGDLPLRVAGGCETYWVYADMPSDPYRRVPPGSQLELCGGDTVAFTPLGLAVLGPDGALTAEVAIDGWLEPGPGPEMASVTITNRTDGEVRVWVGGLETTVIAAGGSADLPLRTSRGACVARRIFAEIPGQEARLQTEMTEVCDGDTALVALDGITVG